MNKKKLIFIIVGGIIVFLVIYLVYTMRSTPTQPKNTDTTTGAFNVWLLGDDSNSFLEVIGDFKQFNTDYKDASIGVVSFDNYSEYEQALASAIISGTAPDLFVLKNNGSSILENQLMGISSDIISPNDFRKKYKGFLGDDLIIKDSEGGETQEFLKGLAVGYETLGIYYNRQKVNSSDLKSLAGLNTAIREIKEKDSNIIPIGMGNGTTVDTSEDIITQFFLLEGVDSLEGLTGNSPKSALGSYFQYGNTKGDNAYDTKYVEQKTLLEDNIDLFSKGELAMVVGYPSLINKIVKSGYGKKYLLAAPFPHHLSGDEKTLASYKYFGINKDTQNVELAHSILQYLDTDNGAESFLKRFPYYLPALLSLESEYLKKKVHPDYNVTLGFFYNSDFELSSFNKGLISVYDSLMRSFLDDSSNYSDSFDKFRSTVLCKTNKITKLEGININCE